MALFGFLNPTQDWPVVDGPAPDLDGPTFQIPALPFGQSMEAAHVLGRPEHVEWHSRTAKDCDLLYASKGLRLEFKQGQLRTVSYLIGNGTSDHVAFVPSKPLAPNGTRLGPAIDRAQIIALFGEPDPDGSDETVLQIFHGCGVASDFYLDEQGRLKEWALYSED